jgi:hypothetical protein
MRTLLDGLARLPKSIPVQLFAAFFAVYCVTAPGGYECVDAVLRYDTARSWLEGRGGALTIAIAPDGAVAPDGRVYSFYGPFQSVLMLPFVALAEKLSHGSPDVLSKLLFGIVGIPFVSALSMAVLFQALASLGYSRRTALWTTIVVGLATPMWHYARSGQEENIVGLGFGLYLWGVGRVFRARYSGLGLAAAGLSVIVATRWSYVPMVGMLLIPVAICLWRRKADAREWRKSLAAALATGLSTLCALFWYNYHRFSNPLETGYGLAYKQHDTPLFVFSRIPANAVALLVSPYRGFLWFCPAIVILFGLRSARRLEPVERLWPFMLAGWMFNLLLASSYSFWSASFAWGPRYLMAPIVLLSPLFAAVFASGQKWRPVLAVSAVIQFCATVLPSSAENYVYSASAGACSPWRCECTAVCLRLPWSLRAIENTAFARPLPVLDSDAASPPDTSSILASSDYNSVYWWPIRAAYRQHKLNPALALALCLTVLAGAGYAFYAIYRRTPIDDATLSAE